MVPDSIEGLLALLPAHGVSVGEGAPPGSGEVIEIYDRQAPPDSSPDAPIAVLGLGSGGMVLWPVGSPEEHLEAWRHLIEECRMYFSLEWQPQDDWAYACYHTTTVSNQVSRTFWARRNRSDAADGRNDEM